MQIKLSALTHFGKQLREIRLSKNLTLKRIGEIIGEQEGGNPVHFANVQKFEENSEKKGKEPAIYANMKMAVRYAKALGAKSVIIDLEEPEVIHNYGIVTGINRRTGMRKMMLGRSTETKCRQFVEEYARQCKNSSPEDILWEDLLVELY